MNPNFILESFLGYSFFSKDLLLDREGESVNCASHLRCLCHVKQISYLATKRTYLNRQLTPSCTEFKQTVPRSKVRALEEEVYLVNLSSVKIIFPPRFREVTSDTTGTLRKYRAGICHILTQERLHTCQR